MLPRGSPLSRGVNLIGWFSYETAMGTADRNDCPVVSTTRAGVEKLCCEREYTKSRKQNCSPLSVSPTPSADKTSVSASKGKTYVKNPASVFSQK